MHHSIVKTALVAAALLLSTSVSFAVESKPGTMGDTSNKTKTTAAKKIKPAAPVKLVDINSASKAALKKLPGISNAEADKIIAGRPYLTKAHLVTRNIISAGVYENLKKLIIAKQKN